MSLSSNNIKKLPEEFGECVKMRELYVNNNAKFSSIPTSIGQLKELEEMSMKKCPALKQLPPTIVDMSSLKELDVRPAKKAVCKITPEMFEALNGQDCVMKGYVIKKSKKKGGKKKKA